MIIDALRYTLQNPDGIFWKDTDYHKQKEIELKNPVFRRNKANHKNKTRKNMRK